MIAKMSEGLGNTCAIFFLTLIISLPLGLVVALLRGSKVKAVSAVARFLISILRGTPLMLQLLAVTYGPYYIATAVNSLCSANGWDFSLSINVARDKLIPVVVAFAINYAAYFAEIYRSGLDSMPVGQYEAAKVLGYSRAQTFLKIILPQVIKRFLPSMTNEIVTLVKDTSLAFTISVAEMFTQAKALASSQASVMPFVAAALFYYVFNFLAAYLMELLEKKLDYYR